MSNEPGPSGKKEKGASKDSLRQDGFTARDAEFAVLFDLEDRYPEAVNLFKDNSVPSTDEQSVMVSLDTNALLLPYSVGKADLKAIADVYQRLAKEQRLFLAGRAAREFIKHRDRKLAEMIKALDVRFHIAAPTMLDTFSGYKEMMDAAEKVTAALKEYDKAKSTIVAGIKSWRGNDPVTKLYHLVFTKDQIIEDDRDRSNIADEWERRGQSQTPPGYKDIGKPDSGIGDFLIWKAILKLGATQKRDLAFVTGETKSDWYVRHAGEPVYPRPELVDEYRRASEGHNLRLMPLADLLAELKAPTKVVREVRQAEETFAHFRKTVSNEIDPWSVVIKGRSTDGTFADAFTELSEAGMEAAIWPTKRILLLPSVVGPVMATRADQHMQTFRIQPLRRLDLHAGEMGNPGIGTLRLEYPRFLGPNDANSILRHARQIDPYASWWESIE